jgi:import inner membrane translocase subunit TIM50
MARHNRPNHPQNQHKKPTEYSKPPDAPPPKPAGEGPTYTSPQGSQGSNKFQAPDFFKKQPEFSQDASPARNTTPNSEVRGAGVSNSEGRGAGVLNSAARKYEHPDFSGKQSEFEAAPSSANTASQTTSPSGIDPSEVHKQQSSPAAEQSEEQPQQPLPDLTQGIPSTIEFEMRENAKRDSLNLTEAEEPAQTSSSGGRGKGELPASAYISSSERKRLRFANYMYASFAAFAVIGTIYWGRNWETEEEEKAHPEAPSGWAIGLMWNRAKARLGDQLNYYSEPAFPKLLPNPDPIFERPYTLVLSLEDLLIHSEWSREHGWRMAKRPGVDYFLRYLSQYYELVIFTTQPWAVADPVIRKLDPYHIVTWPLYREATLYEKGEYIKAGYSQHTAKTIC